MHDFAYLMGKLAAAAGALQGMNMPQGAMPTPGAQHSTITAKMPLRPPGGPAKPNPKVNPGQGNFLANTGGQGNFLATMQNKSPHMNLNFGAQTGAVNTTGGQ